MKQTTTPSPVNVTPSLTEFQKLTPTQAAQGVVEQANAGNRAFIAVTKLLLALEPTLRPGQTLGGVVIKLANVHADDRRRIKSTIDNARQSMRVWKELVDPGHITEADFNDFTFGDHVIVNKVMSGASRQKLTPADVALIMQSSSQNWHEELECLFHYGQTLADRSAVEEKQAAKKAEKDETNADETCEETPASESETENATPASEPAPGKVIKMPVTATADDAFKLIAALESLINSMEHSEVEKVAPAIAELNTTVQSALKPAKKAAAKRKVAHRKPAKKAA
jgi:hypothetical protein